MADVSLLLTSGAQPNKPSKFFPLSTQQFFSGLWTNRSPFNGPDNRVARKYYGGRPDILIDGLNVELTNYGTYIRRPGMTAFSNQTLSGAIQNFYSFHQITGASNPIDIIVDTATEIDKLTATSKTLILTKANGAGQAYFQGVGNTLYIGDGVEQKAWSEINGIRNWGISNSSGSAGPTITGNGANIAIPSLGTDWTNPNNVTSAVSFATVAVVPLTIGSHTLAATQFGFAVSGNISGIQVSFTAGSTNNNSPLAVFLTQNSNIIGQQRQLTLTNANVNYTIGNITDTWGVTNLDSNAVNSTTFGVGFQASYPLLNSTYSINNVKITVYTGVVPTVTQVGVGTFTATQGYQYVYTYGNSLSGHQSSATTASITTGPFSVGIDHLSISVIASPDPQVNEIHLYRTKDGGAIFFELPTSPYANSTTNISDSALDTALSPLITPPFAPLNNPPPVGLVKMTYHLGRIWGVVNNLVYFSGGPDTLVGNGNEAWPPANVFVFQGQVNRLLPLPNGLLVFTVDDCYLISGTTIATFYVILFQEGLGLLNYNSLDIQGSNIFLYSADRQFINLNAAGVNEIGFPIGDQLQANFDPGTDIHVASLIAGQDKAVFIGNATGDWYRCNWNQMPEGGPAFSPKATITGGFTHIQSIETAPGLHQLLIGTSGGNVYYRDTTTQQDAGSNYTWFFTVGSLVLAQPGQLAEVESITLEAKNVGTLPTVSVLLEEISGAFEALPNSVSDPPYLTASSTLFSKRFYLTQGAKTIACRHLQVKVAGISENFKNEILTLSVWGALSLHE